LKKCGKNFKKKYARINGGTESKVIEAQTCPHGTSMPTMANAADATGIVIAREEVRTNARKNSFHIKMKVKIAIPNKLGEVIGKEIL